MILLDAVGAPAKDLYGFIAFIILLIIAFPFAVVSFFRLLDWLRERKNLKLMD
jgi:hypothetical protein